MLTVANRLRESELPFDREQWLRCQLEDNPLAMSNVNCLHSVAMMGPAFLAQEKGEKGKGERSESREETVNSNAGGSLEPRSKQYQRGSLKSMEEEHRMISRENMELLGLTIQKISYATKGQFSKKTESTRSVAHGLVP